MPIDLTQPLSHIWSFLLALARVGGAIALVPVPGWRRAPEAARIVFAFSLTLALSPVWPSGPVTVGGAGEVLGLVFTETLLGLSLGLAVSLVVEGFTIAAQILGLQAGYAYASTIDPSTEADSGVLPVIAQLCASLLFFTLGMDAQVIRALAQSFSNHPPGVWMAGAAHLDTILELGAGMWKTALRLALPVVGLLILLDLSMAILGKVATQLQLLTLAFPAKMLMALAVLSMLAGVLPELFREQAALAVAQWSK